MFAPDDTIVAIATPPGRGGIGVVRISGPRSAEIAAAILTRRSPLEPRMATFTRLRATDAGGASAGQVPGRVLDAGGADDAMDPGGASPHADLDRAGAAGGAPQDLRARAGSLVVDEARGCAIADHVVVTSFPAPHSYTGQDVIEISAHGSPIVLRAIVDAAMQAGARLAQPGEFTLRAFLNGKLDLVQAEGVGDLIAAATPLQARIAFDQLEGTLTARIAVVDAELFDLIARLEASLDFPDEGYHFVEAGEINRRLEALVADLDLLIAAGRRGRVIREGATVVIAGRSNVGKSSLFNMLAGFDRAIVADGAGTTRDLITERVDMGGVPITLVDTAGARDVCDIVEREGLTRASRAREIADLLVIVIDASEPLTGDDHLVLDQTKHRERILVANKTDRPAAQTLAGTHRVSAATGEGVEALRRAIVARLTGGECLRDTAVVANMRHIALLREARHALERARAGAATGGVAEEFLLVDLQDARGRFDEIVGKRTTDDMLRHIFERFCIGK